MTTLSLQYPILKYTIISSRLFLSNSMFWRVFSQGFQNFSEFVHLITYDVSRYMKRNILCVDITRLKVIIIMIALKKGILITRPIVMITFNRKIDGKP